MTLDLATHDDGLERPGAPVILIHGTMGTGRNWRALQPVLAHRRPVVAVDVRNHGASPWSDVMRYPALAADVSRLIDARGLDRCIVVGHSLGGKVAMRLALDRPDAVGAVVVLDIGPIDYADEHTGFFQKILAMPIREMTSPDQADAYLMRIEPNAELRQFMLDNIVRVDGRLRWRANVAVLAASGPDMISWPPVADGARFDGPVLVLKGEFSPYLPPHPLAELAHRFPQLEIETVPGARHWPQIENRGDCNRRILAFVDRVDPGPGTGRG